jgi:1-aminocyclopropane-1-carboxylate deaminase/D-cysteine desulfhydrase-like pyridoxal-dependent ACC family enzyme
MAADLPLFEFSPGLAEHCPRIALGRFPTPVEQHTLRSAGRALALLVKRDDVCAAPYGGNKIRKLEFLLGAARARGARRLITAGATGSHHALATTVHGRAHGFDVSLVLFPQPRTSHVRDVLLMDHGLGAELRFSPSMQRLPLALLRARYEHRRERPCMIPPGGSNAVGTLGYVNAALEFGRQIERSGNARPAAVYVAAGTLGTAAGLALGFAIAGIDTRIVAVRITSRVVTNMRVLRRLIAGARRLLARAGAAVPTVADALRLVTLRHDQIGAGYGRATAAGDDATRRFAEIGMQLDDTYTAKAAAALLADSAAEEGTPLFWHTLSAVEPRAVLEATTPSQLPAPFAAYLRRP